MRPRLALLTLAAFALLTACRDAKVENYRVPKEKPDPLPPILTGEVPVPPSAPTAGADMASTAVPTATGEGLTWTAPAEWHAKPLSTMRKGSYAVTGADGAEADLSITAFPGDVGGELANVNRWRGQLQLGPLGEAELAGATTSVNHNGLTFVVVDIANPSASSPQRILGAFAAYDGATWYFKLMGPDALVARAKPAFLAFLQTVKPATP
jgi:hypothetical protein